MSVPRILLTVAVSLVAALPQALTDDPIDNQHNVDKRHVGVLARTGQLPFHQRQDQGKRYVAALARNGDFPFRIRKEWNKKMHPMMSGRNMADYSPRDYLLNDKRYVGSLARSGNMPFYREGKRSEEEPSEVENMLQGVLATEDLWKLQLEALKQELMREQEEQLEDQELEEDYDKDKRSLAALAKSGNMPFRSDKRSVEALARAGYLPAPKSPNSSTNQPMDTSEGDNTMDKRSISSLAKNGQISQVRDIFQEEMDEEKRGGIGSLARNGHIHKKSEDGSVEDMEDLMEELYDEDPEKRNIGSLARSFSYPHGGKRNLGSLARGGGFSNLRFSPSKKDYIEDEDDGDMEEEEKRSITSLMRNRLTPFSEGKRYLGSVLRGQSSQFGMSKREDMSELEDEVKRNIGAMARNWYLPDHLKYGKRLSESDNEEMDVEGVAKRYVAALLRHGRLPVGGVMSNDNSDNKGSSSNEEKRHIGSLAAKSSYQLHKKSSRSTGSDLQAYHHNDSDLQSAPKMKRSAGPTPPHENQIPATTTDKAGKRTKRQAFLVPPAALSDEYPMPVMQNTDLFDYEDLAEFMSGGSAPEKRFLGSVARSGWFRDASGHTSGVTKRHIGSLARLGWLPAFRSARYSRSGRAPVGKRTVIRADTTDGTQPSQDTLAIWPQTPALEQQLDDDATGVFIDDSHVGQVKRYLLLPAVDNILLRRLYPRRMVHL